MGQAGGVAPGHAGGWIDDLFDDLGGVGRSVTVPTPSRRGQLHGTGSQASRQQPETVVGPHHRWHRACEREAQWIPGTRSLDRTVWEFGAPSLCPGGYLAPRPLGFNPLRKGGADADRRRLEMPKRHLTTDIFIMDTGRHNSPRNSATDPMKQGNAVSHDRSSNSTRCRGWPVACPYSRSREM